MARSAHSQRSGKGIGLVHFSFPHNISPPRLSLSSLSSSLDERYGRAAWSLDAWIHLGWARDDQIRRRQAIDGVADGRRRATSGSTSAGLAIGGWRHRRRRVVGGAADGRLPHALKGRLPRSDPVAIPDQCGSSDSGRRSKMAAGRRALEFLRFFSDIYFCVRTT